MGGKEGRRKEGKGGKWSGGRKEVIPQQEKEILLISSVKANIVRSVDLLRS